MNSLCRIVFRIATAAVGATCSIAVHTSSLGYGAGPANQQVQQPHNKDEDQTDIGVGNHAAITLSRRSPMVQSALRFLIAQASKVKDPILRKQTLDAISNESTCVQHRAHLSDQNQRDVVQRLIAAGLLDSPDGATFPGGLRAGIFPPVRADGSACPQLPQTFFSAPGGAFHSHHSYPGGLPIHEANNGIAHVNLANEYRMVYGHSDGTFPVLNPAPKWTGQKAAADVLIDQDIILAAPILHDWAKAIVFQWRRDGSQFQEIGVGGNGTTDNRGAPGNSKTGAHHVLGIAESMKRGLNPAFVIVQASAHAPPSSGNEYKVVNWLRAASIIAQIDAVEKGYLTLDKNGQWWLPSIRSLGSANGANPSSATSNLLIECTLHNLSDSDASYSSLALRSIERVLSDIAQDFGFNPNDSERFNNGFRNPVLSFLTAERLLMIYSERGVTGVKQEVQKLRQKRII